MADNNSNTSKKSTSSQKQFISGLKTSAKDKLANMTAEERQDIFDSFKAVAANKLIHSSSIANTIDFKIYTRGIDTDSQVNQQKKIKDVVPKD